MFFDEAHQHVLQFPVVPFRWPLAWGWYADVYTLLNLAQALKEPGSELLPVICQN